MEAFETEEQQVEAIKKWFKQHGKNLMTAALVVAVCVLGFKYWRHQQAVIKEQASEHYMGLMMSQNQEDEQSALAKANLLVKDYTKTPYAQLAALYIAKVHVEHGEFEQALEQLQWVIDNDNVGEFVLIARTRAARIHLSMGQYEQAMAMIDVDDVNGFSPTILEVKGDILLAQEKKDEALAAYKSAWQKTQDKDLDNPFLKFKLQDLGWVASAGDQA